MATPDHIAIIIDGNGRWAQKHDVSRLEGHVVGGQNVPRIVEKAAHRQIKRLTIYAFSMEDWRRPEALIINLMKIFRDVILEALPTLQKLNVKVETIGNLVGIPKDTARAYEKVVLATRDNDGMILTIALNYSARWEIEQAALRVAQVGGTVQEHLQLRSDPDLIIRTGGDKRLSNFLLYQAAYSELYFTEILWPDFSPEDLDDAINDYKKRERRFGAIIDQQ